MGLPPWPLGLCHSPSLCCSLTSFSLPWISTFTSLCNAVSSAQDLPVSPLHHPDPHSVSPPPRDPPCQPVSGTHSPFSTPCFLSSSCLAVLKSILFILLFVHIPHFRMSSLWEQGFVFFTIMSPQHLEQSWCHRMCPWVPAVDCTVPGASLLLFPLNAASSSWTDCHTVSTGLNSLSPILQKVYFSQFLYLEWVIYSCGPSCFTVDIHEHGLSILWSWYQLT